MEKCTYCVQRISAAKIEAEKQDRTVRDGDILTACQAVCPTHAIVFGDINDKSRVRQADPQLRALAELNTRPARRARITNPSPALEGRVIAARRRKRIGAPGIQPVTYGRDKIADVWPDARP
jgi:molybdopterin-containing oxidoreductase family iron-sulfur binding subunit